MKKQQQDAGWNLDAAIAALRARIDPYIWEQGQELFRRGAVEDAQQGADGKLHVSVLDPRDARKFFVIIEKDRDARVTAKCPCPYRLGGLCRHQVVALEFLRSLQAGAAGSEAAPAPAAAAEAPAPPRGPVLYRLFGEDLEVSAQPDGSLLRVVLGALGSLKTPTRIGLQLYTGKGWTELRTGDLERWTSRGKHAPHPRDAAIAAALVRGGELLRDLDAELLARLLGILAGSSALADRSGREIVVSRSPCTLACRLVRGERAGVDVRLCCRLPDGEEAPLDEVAIVPAAAAWVQVPDGAMHPLVSGAAGPDLEELQEADLAAVTGAELDRLLLEGVGKLERLCGGAVEIEPGLVEEVEGVTAARMVLTGTPVKLSGRLELCYGEEWIPAPETPEPWTVTRDGTIHRYPPAGQSLARAERDLAAVGFRRDEDGWTLERLDALGRALAPRARPFVSFVLPAQLDALNCVERAPLLRVKVGTGGGQGAPAGGVAPGKGSGIAWLDVTLTLADGDRALPIDFAALREERAAGSDLAQLKDGTVLSLRHDAVRSALELCEAAGGAPGAGGRLRLPLHGIGDLLEAAPGREVEFGMEVHDLVRGLRGEEVAAPDLLPGTAALLRPYQLEAVAWLGQLSKWGLGGILADEMGLGKTVMALAHFFGRDAGKQDAQGPVLVVCPSSLVFNWVAECRRFFPDVDVRGLYGLPSTEREAAIRSGADLLVTSYALLRRDREVFEARELRAALLDEAQHIKNAASQTAQAAFALRAGERWILTGTPIENHLGELWSHFHFLMPGFLGTRAAFEEEVAGPIARRDEEVLARLRVRVRPFLLRRTKAQVLTELPPRIDQVERVPLTDFQRRVYESYLAEARREAEAGDTPQSRFKILAALTRLRQICCHPRLVLDESEVAKLDVDPEEVTGGKFELVNELLEECLEEGHRVLLYSQFTSMLDIIEERLEARGVPRCRLDGSTRDREGVVRRFAQDPAIPVFLISLKAGGFGLNLTQADTVILYDPWWNPAAEEQAAARAHRMGQTLPVHVHKLITAGTVEEKILELQARKRDLADRVIRSDEEAVEALTLDDLKGLLTS
jgi:superfamily II DNA or RNA helicase